MLQRVARTTFSLHQMPKRQRLAGSGQKHRPVPLFAALLGCFLIAFALFGWQKAAAQSDKGLAVDLPDLVVVGIASAQNLGGCQAAPAGLLVTVRNIGAAPAHSFYTTLTGGSTSCGPWFLASLESGEESIFYCPAAMPGASLYTATVDSTGVVTESNELDNVLTATVWVITLPTCTIYPSPTPTPTATPTGWLGNLTIFGQVRDQADNDPLPGAMVSGYVQSLHGSGGALPVATVQPDGSYQLPVGFALRDTDHLYLSASAVGYVDGSADRSALAIYSGQAVNFALTRIPRTPTPTPTGATFLHITVGLQGRPAAPDPSWQSLLRLRLFVGGQLVLTETRACDSSGSIRLENLTPGDYSLYVKGQGALSNYRASVPVVGGANLLHMGVLRAGDANDDDAIDIVDFSLFRTLFGTADVRADFDNSGLVDISDFTLLRLNFGRQGPIAVP
jgi:hypothetical protein